MFIKIVCCTLLICNALLGMSQQADEFWEKWSLQSAKIFKVSEQNLVNERKVYPGNTGFSVQWNNSAQLFLSIKDRFSTEKTIENTKQFFLSDPNRTPWVEYFEGDIFVLDSATHINYSPAWNTGAELTSHIKKGWGVTIAVDYSKTKISQNNYLSIFPFVPTSEPMTVKIKNERNTKMINLFLGASYQFLSKRVQPALTFGYQLSRASTKQFNLSHLNLESTVPMNSQVTLHGWRIQLMAKVFIIKGWYIAPIVELGQLFQSSAIHTQFNGGAGLGYQFNLNRK